MAGKKPVVNIDSAPLSERTHGEKFAVKLSRLGPLIGASKLGCTLTIVPPGKRAFPLHVHHANEEMFYILVGSGQYRIGKEIYAVKAGDILAALPGGLELAHQIVNTGSEELKYLSFSTMLTPEVVEYPDSGKFGVISRPNEEHTQVQFHFFGRQASAVDYWDGE